MAKSKKETKNETGDITTIQSLTPENKKSIEALIQNMQKIKLDQEAVKDDLSAIAAKIGCKPGALSALVSLIMKEQEKGGVISEKEKHLELAKQFFE
jgi:hypothetical protein